MAHCGSKKMKYGGSVKKMKEGGAAKESESTNKKTGATRGAGDDKEYMRKAAEANKYEGGGAVPKQYKGFSKLPEAVQMKMDPAAARKYEDGGAVRGMGRAYQGKPRTCKVR